MNVIVQAENLKKVYGDKHNKVYALRDVSLQIEQGEFVAIVGKSGSGKSTLLHMLGALDTPTSGEVFVGAQQLSKLSEEKAAIFRRRKIGFIFQSFNLISSLTVWENIVLPIGLEGMKPDVPYLNELLDALGLSNKKDAMPSALSGGEQQRVAIARALSMRPEIILADEPTGNLDSKTSADVMNLFRVVTKKFASTLIMITHDDDIALTADRKIVISDGVVMENV